MASCWVLHTLEMIKPVQVQSFFSAVVVSKAQTVSLGALARERKREQNMVHNLLRYHHRDKQIIYVLVTVYR